MGIQAACHVPQENAFNAIRFFFCLVVIIMHCGWPGRIFDGHVAVCAFFILSGFWVTKSCLAAPSTRAFWLKRARRLLPMYYLAVGGFAVLLVFFSTLPAREYFASGGFWRYLFWNGIFLNFVCPSLPGVFEGRAVNGSLWTIKVEVGFYIILPFLIWALGKLGTRKRQNSLLAVVYALSVLWNVLLSRYAVRLGLPEQLSYQLPGFMSFFVSGMAYILNWDALRKAEGRLIVPAAAAFVLHYVTGTEVLLPAALAVIIFFVGTRCAFLSRVGRPTDYSYCMYLFHFPLVQAARTLGFFASAPVFCTLIIIVAVLGMAFVAEKYLASRAR